MMQPIHHKKGFTLIETLMAVSIITISIIGPLAMASEASRLVSVARNQLIAAYLGQEAMEFVRQMRDTNMIKANADPSADIDWITGAGNASPLHLCVVDSTEAQDPAVFEKSGCYMDLDAGGITSCRDLNSGCLDNNNNPAANMCYKVDSNGEVFGYMYRNFGLNATDADCKPTSFRRFITVEPIGVDNGAGTGELVEDAAKVTVKIMWTDSYGEKTNYLQENIYKYR